MNTFPRRFLPFLYVSLFLSGLALVLGAEEEEKKNLIPWKAPVEGVVFADGNGNETFDTSDLPGRGLKVKLILLGVEEVEVASLRSDEKGAFEFPSVPEGTYRVEVHGQLEEVAKSSPFAIEAGKAPPFLAVQVRSYPGKQFRGRIANPDNTSGNIISPFSPDSNKNLSRKGKEE